jgi:hypothetical protein
MAIGSKCSSEDDDDEHLEKLLAELDDEDGVDDEDENKDEEDRASINEVPTGLSMSWEWLSMLHV